MNPNLQVNGDWNVIIASQVADDLQDFSVVVGWGGVNAGQTFTHDLTADFYKLTKQPVAQLPAAHNDAYVGYHDQQLSVGQPGVLWDDYDPEGDPLSVVAVNGNYTSVGSPLTLPSGAIVTLNGDGSFTYQPPTGFVGEDSFTYTIRDEQDESMAAVYIDVINRAPIAESDSHSVLHDTTLNGSPGLLFNDSDPDGDTISIVGVNGATGNVGVPITLPSGATLTVQANGDFTYVPPMAFAGVDTFTYTLGDGFDESIATVYIDVTNQAPIATSDSHSVLHDTTLYGNPPLLFNDYDPDGDTLTVMRVNGSSGVIGYPITLASGATLTVYPDGTFEYVPPAGFVGQDSFTYTISDGIAEAEATVIIDVLA